MRPLQTLSHQIKQLAYIPFVFPTINTCVVSLRLILLSIFYHRALNTGHAHKLLIHEDSFFLIIKISGQLLALLLKQPSYLQFFSFRVLRRIAARLYWHSSTQGGPFSCREYNLPSNRLALEGLKFCTEVYHLLAGNRVLRRCWTSGKLRCTEYRKTRRTNRYTKPSCLETISRNYFQREIVGSC